VRHHLAAAPFGDGPGGAGQGQVAAHAEPAGGGTQQLVEQLVRDPRPQVPPATGGAEQGLHRHLGRVDRTGRGRAVPPDRKPVEQVRRQRRQVVPRAGGDPPAGGRPPCGHAVPFDVGDVGAGDGHHCPDHGGAGPGQVRDHDRRDSRQPVGCGSRRRRKRWC
jgi:hypothetical protein